MKSKIQSNKIIPIILAAGRGSRMGALTKNKPKSFVKINKKKKLIDNVIENFLNFDFKKLVIITGYQSYKFKRFKKIQKIKNNHWQKTNIFGSLICADKLLSKYSCIISYADIFYENEAVQQLIKFKKKGIILLSYKYWKNYWKQRFINPLDDLETFKISKDNRLLQIGDRPRTYKDIQGQYMGIFKIDPETWKKIKKKLIDRNKEIKTKDITSIFSLILKRKICNIYSEEYNKKWFEIDNIKDYKIFIKSIEK